MQCAAGGAGPHRAHGLGRWRAGSAPGAAVLRAGVWQLPHGLCARFAARAFMATDHERVGPALRNRCVAGRGERPEDRRLAAGQRRHLQTGARGASAGPHDPVQLVPAQTPRGGTGRVSPRQHQECGQLHCLPWRRRSGQFQRTRRSHSEVRTP